MKKDDFWETMAEIDDLLYDKKGDTTKVKTYKDFCDYKREDANFDLDERVQFLTNRDKAYCILFGAFGALTAASLSEPLSKIHDKQYLKKDNAVLWRVAKYLEHPNTYPDKEIGGLSHRAKFGHDVFNLKEVYECIQEDGKGDLPKGMWDYIKHVILADPLSKQGIPIPGSSLFKDKVVAVAKEDQNFYKSVLTYKHKDLMGYLLVEGLVRFYNSYYKLSENMYRYHEMHFYSQFINLAMGFCLFTPETVNCASLLRMTKSFYNLSNLSKKLNGEWRKQSEDIINKYRC